MPEMRSTNPVFTRGGGFGRAAAPTDPATPSAEDLASLYRQPGTLTIDDVIIHTAGLMGVVGPGLLDLVIRLVSGSHLRIINDASPLGILFSLAVLAVASLQFVLDFDYIERAIAAGAPRSEAWRASYGLLIGFVWV